MGNKISLEYRWYLTLSKTYYLNGVVFKICSKLTWLEQILRIRKFPSTFAPNRTDWYMNGSSFIQNFPHRPKVRFYQNLTWVRPSLREQYTPQKWLTIKSTNTHLIIISIITLVQHVFISTRFESDIHLLSEYSFYFYIFILIFSFILFYFVYFFYSFFPFFD